MDDDAIVQLYWERDERALTVTAQKYGHYCTAIARNILGNEEDTEECVNDTYLHAWNAMPDDRPERLGAFLGKITRNLAFSRYRHDRAEKRGSGETGLILDELAELLAGGDEPERLLDRQELLDALNDFVRRLPEEKRRLFIRRYWYADSIAQLAQERGRPQSTVAKALERFRGQLKSELEKKGFAL